MLYDLELTCLEKTYDNGTPAVLDFNLKVEKGEFIAFLGPSGCGKTTTLRMIAGFESITGGDLRIRGKRYNEVPPERRPTSMIFQNYALFPHMTVRRNVGYGLEVKGMPRPEREAKVDRILDRLGLSDIAGQRPDQLSGGQRQRIALARGLGVEPQILLLDEPLGALDANLRKAIQAELKLLQRNLGITFVFVTHAQSEALTLSDRVVVMNQGRIEQVSTPLTLYTRPATPFVARFIGRNTIFPGSAGPQPGQVTTEFGAFSGTPGGRVAAHAAAEIVIPSEAFDVFDAETRDHDSLAAEYAGNVVEGRITRREVVGYLVTLDVALASGRPVAVEGHIEKFGADALGPGQQVRLAWPQQEATVIAA